MILEMLYRRNTRDIGSGGMKMRYLATCAVILSKLIQHMKRMKAPLRF